MYVSLFVYVIFFIRNNRLVRKVFMDFKGLREKEVQVKLLYFVILLEWLYYIIYKDNSLKFL